MILGVVVFLSAILTDVVWTRWMLAISERRAVMAGMFAALITCLGVIGIEAYVQTPIYVIPAALGAAVGTFVTVRRAK